MPATLVSGQGVGDAGSTAGHGQARRSAKGVFAPTIGFAGLLRARARLLTKDLRGLCGAVALSLHDGQSSLS